MFLNEFESDEIVSHPVFGHSVYRISHTENSVVFGWEMFFDRQKTSEVCPIPIQHWDGWFRVSDQKTDKFVVGDCICLNNSTVRRKITRIVDGRIFGVSIFENNDLSRTERFIVYVWNLDRWSKNQHV